MTGRDALTGQDAPPPSMLTELEALRVALPGYDVVITSHGLRYRYEAIRQGNRPGPWCLISADPADLRRELAPFARPAAQTTARSPRWRCGDERPRFPERTAGPAQ